MSILFPISPHITVHTGDTAISVIQKLDPKLQDWISENKNIYCYTYQNKSFALVSEFNKKFILDFLYVIPGLSNQLSIYPLLVYLKSIPNLYVYSSLSAEDSFRALGYTFIEYLQHPETEESIVIFRSG